VTREAVDTRSRNRALADALDMEQGRSRIPFERGSISIHSLSAAAIEDVAINGRRAAPGADRDHDEHSSGIYQWTAC